MAAPFVMPADPVAAAAIESYMAYESAVNSVLDPFRTILRANLNYYIATFSILLWDTLMQIQVRGPCRCSSG